MSDPDPNKAPNSAETVVKKTKAPIWFWVIAVIALLWNLMGLMAFVIDTTMSAEAIAELPADHQALINSTPIWVKIAYGLAVVCGTLGSIGLLMRKRWAFPVFVVSLLGVIAQQTHIFFLSDTLKVLGNSILALPILVLTGAILLVIFSKVSRHLR